MHEPIRETAEWLKQVVAGYFQYHAVPTNGAALGAFRYHVIKLWRRTLRRRGQKHRQYRFFASVIVDGSYIRQCAPMSGTDLFNAEIRQSRSVTFYLVTHQLYYTFLIIRPRKKMSIPARELEQRSDVMDVCRSECGDVASPQIAGFQ